MADRTITFHELPYTEVVLPSGGSIWQPLIEVDFRFPGFENDPYIVPALLDSGSSYCVVPENVAEAYGIDTASAPPAMVSGVSGIANGHYIEVGVAVLGLGVPACPVLSVPDVGRFIVGRVPFFQAFHFAFHEENDPQFNTILYSDPRTNSTGRVEVTFY